MVERQEENSDTVSETIPIQPDSRDGSKVVCADCVLRANEYKQLEQKYKELKQRYMKLTMHHSEVDMKYNDLLKSVTGKNHGNDGDVENEPENASSDGVFTLNELKFLKCMALDKKKDSTFIHQSLQFAYKSNQSVLVHKTLKGSRDWIEIADNGDEIFHSGKESLSPHKVNRIKELFIERIGKCKIDSVSYGQRVKDAYINQLIASGIKNISKKH